MARNGGEPTRKTQRDRYYGDRSTEGKGEMIIIVKGGRGRGNEKAKETTVKIVRGKAWGGEGEGRGEISGETLM